MHVLDLFCGAGGFSCGFQQAGHTIVAGIDNDPRVMETYQKNHPHAKFILSDIQELDPTEIMLEGEPIELSTIDIVIGSPPCPEFSKAKADKDPAKGMILVDEFIKWIQVIQPKWWIMENVDTIEPFLTIGYPKKKVLDAVNYGVAQFRKRCFAGKYKIPRPTHGKVSTVTFDNRRIKKWRTVRDVIGDLLDLPAKLILTDQRGNIENCRANSPTYDASNRPSRTVTNVPQRIVLSQLNPTVLKKHPPMKLDKPARGIIANLKRQGQYGLVEVQKHKYRRLTVREVARLQSFPDNFAFYGSKSANYMMIGNAVPPLMAFNLGVLLK